jgi:hypothetical protein
MFALGRREIEHEFEAGTSDVVRGGAAGGMLSHLAAAGVAHTRADVLVSKRIAAQEFVVVSGVRRNPSSLTARHSRIPIRPRDKFQEAFRL